jgi:NTP pyrophosphatase (non-canonical NTP hydrolase)
MMSSTSRTSWTPRQTNLSSDYWSLIPDKPIDDWLGWQGEAVGAVIIERRRQDDRWGTNHVSRPADEWFLILSEEVGEVAKGILEREDWPDVRKELVQVAAVAISAIEYLDQQNYGE